MRLAVLIDRYLPVLGGAQNNVHQLARDLQPEGIEVRVLCRRSAAGLPTRERIDGIEVLRFGAAQGRLASKLRAAAGITRELIRGGYDAVLAAPCAYTTDLLPAYLAHRARGLPYLVRTTMIDSVPGLLGWRPRTLPEGLGKLLLPPVVWRRALRCSARVVVQSAAVRSQVGRFDLPSRVIANGVDVRRFAPSGEPGRRRLRARLELPPDRVTLVTSGRYVRAKNQMALLHAMEALESQHFPGRLLLLVLGATEAGQVTSNEAELKRRVHERGLSGVVRFVDDARNVEDYLGASDLFVFPSRYPEGMSNALLEAMACGLPVVCSDLPQNACLVPDAAGDLVDPRDLDAWTACLAGWIAAPARRAAAGAAAAAHVRAHFPSERATAAWLALLREVVPLAAAPDLANQLSPVRASGS